MACGQASIPDSIDRMMLHDCRVHASSAAAASAATLRMTSPRESRPRWSRRVIPATGPGAAAVCGAGSFGLAAFAAQ